MSTDEKIVRFADGWMQHGFTQIPNVVLLNGGLSSGAKCLWGTLAHYARQSNECYPGQERIAAQLGASERSVRTYLRELEDMKLVETTRRQQKSNLYTLLSPSAEMVADFDRQKLPVGPAKAADPVRQKLPGKDMQTEGEAGEEETALAASDDATGTFESGPLLSIDGEGQLFETPGVTIDNADIVTHPASRLRHDALTVWTSYVQHFEARLRVKELTAPRERTINKALKAVGWTESPDDAGASARTAAVELCQRAIVGLKSYRADHPDGSQDVNISVIFETGPHSKSNLTDQITWWADQGKSSVPGRDSQIRIPLDLAGVPSVTKGTIQNRRREVGQMFDHPDSPSAQERGKLAVTWLREHIGHEPKIEDGEFRGWQLVVDYTPPSREDA